MSISVLPCNSETIASPREPYPVACVASHRVISTATDAGPRHLPSADARRWVILQQQPFVREHLDSSRELCRPLSMIGPLDPLCAGTPVRAHNQSHSRSHRRCHTPPLAVVSPDLRPGSRAPVRWPVPPPSALPCSSSWARPVWLSSCCLSVRSSTAKSAQRLSSSSSALYNA